MTYDFLSEVSKGFQEKHVQQNGETPAETIARVERSAALRAKFQRNSEVMIEVGRKVAPIKARILECTYEDEEKLNGAIEKLLDVLADVA